MPRIITLLSSLILASLTTFAVAQTQTSAYYYQSGRSAAERLLKTQTLDAAQVDQLIEGFKSQLQNQESIYSEAQISDATEQYHRLKNAELERLSLSNFQKGDTYFAKLREDLSYTFSNSELAYKVITQGSGSIPTESQSVLISYTGRHLDGKTFDQSEQAIWQNVKSVLPGWREALLQMPVGSEWILVVPPQLAYAEYGAGDRVGPHETLIFDLKLLAIR